MAAGHNSYTRVQGLFRLYPVDTLHHKEDYTNLCFERLPVFQGKQCHSKSTLNSVAGLQ